MNKSLRKWVTGVAVACVAGTASADVLTFDDLGFEYVPSSYQGFTFEGPRLSPTTSTQYADWFYDDNEFFFSSRPGSSLATFFNPDDLGATEESAAIKRSTSFLFNGAEFAGAATDEGNPTGFTVRFAMYLAGNLVAVSDEMLLTEPNGQFLNSGYSGQVDEIRVIGPLGYYEMDNFTFNVPEPATGGLMLAAMGALLLTSRRRRQGL